MQDDTSLASLPLDIFMILINSSSTLVITKTNEKKQKTINKNKINGTEKKTRS